MRWSAEQIAEVLRRPSPTPEQRAVIEAPLEPMLVVAGAGSGKTETMAARVVWLIANELVAPDAVLGLTFTRKAAGELSERVRARLAALRRLDAAGPASSVFMAPTVSTYHAYAASLVADHALRLGIEPATRLLGEAGRWQLAHDVVERWGGDLDTDLAVSTVTAAVLDLADGLAEHLSTPEQLAAWCRRVADRLAVAPSGGRKTDAAAVGKVASSLRLRADLAPLLAEVAARKRSRDLMDFADQVAWRRGWPARCPRWARGSAPGSRWSCSTSTRTPPSPSSTCCVICSAAGPPPRPLPGAGHPVTAVGDPTSRSTAGAGRAREACPVPREFRRPRRTAAATRRCSRCPFVAQRRGGADAANRLAEPLRATSPHSVASCGGRTPDRAWWPRPSRPTSTTRWPSWPGSSPSTGAAGPGRPGDGRRAVPQARAVSARGGRCARGLPVEVVGLAGCSPRPRWWTW